MVSVIFNPGPPRWSIKKTVLAAFKVLASVAAIAWAAVTLSLYATLSVALICAPFFGKVIYDVATYARRWLQARRHNNAMRAIIEDFYPSRKKARRSIWRLFKKEKPAATWDEIMRRTRKRTAKKGISL